MGTRGIVAAAGLVVAFGLGIWVLTTRPADAPWFDPRRGTEATQVPSLASVSGPEIEDDRVVEGHVVDEQTRSGVPNAAVETLVDGAVVTRSSTDALGRFKTRIAADTETIVLRAVGVGYSIAEESRPISEAGDVVISLRRGAMRGRLEVTIRRADGRPAAGARAWIVLDEPGFPPLAAASEEEAQEIRVLSEREGRVSPFDQGWEAAQDRAVLCDIVADGDGRLTFPALPCRAYRLRAVVDLTQNGASPAEDEISDMEAGAAAEAGEAGAVVEPQPATLVAVQLAPTRTVRGRVIVREDPSWSDGRSWHSHVVEVEGWPWLRSAIFRTGSHDRPEGTRVDNPGDFRVVGVPRLPCTLRVGSSWGEWAHPDVEVRLRDGGDVDVGTVPVKLGRVLEGRITWGDGGPIRAGRLFLSNGTDEIEGDLIVHHGATGWVESTYRFCLAVRPIGFDRLELRTSNPVTLPFAELPRGGGRLDRDVRLPLPEARETATPQLDAGR